MTEEYKPSEEEMQQADEMITSQERIGSGFRENLQDFSNKELARFIENIDRQTEPGQLEVAIAELLRRLNVKN